MAMGHAHQDLIPPLATVLARRCTAGAVVEPMVSPGSAGLAEEADLLGTTALVYQHASRDRTRAGRQALGHHDVDSRAESSSGTQHSGEEYVLRDCTHPYSEELSLSRIVYTDQEVAGVSDEETRNCKLRSPPLRPSGVVLRDARFSGC